MAFNWHWGRPQSKASSGSLDGGTGASARRNYVVKWSSLKTICLCVCACACALTQTGAFKNLNIIFAAATAFMACAIKISGFISPPRSSGAKTAKCTAEIKLQRKEKREQQNYIQNKRGTAGNTQHGHKSSAIATWRVSRRKLVFLLHNFAGG